jgi:hypothetical protein
MRIHCRNCQLLVRLDEPVVVAVLVDGDCGRGHYSTDMVRHTKGLLVCHYSNVRTVGEMTVFAPD